MARTLSGNLTGRAARGVDELDNIEPSTLTDDERTAIGNGVFDRMFADVAEYFQLAHTTEQDADDLAALVDVVNASEPLDTVDAQDAARWQDTHVTDPADVSKYFNGIKATASKTWRERHLNEGG